jgi:metal-dependent hydrolase (beta-lactamase superfamily II)
VRVTGTAQRDAWLAHAFPPVERAGPDLWSVPVPIPDSPLRYTLTYLVAAGGGLVVVDPGWDTEAGWQALAAGLKAAGASPADVTGIVVTHIHPDHHGLSAYLRSLELVAAYDQAEARQPRPRTGPSDTARFILPEAGTRSHSDPGPAGSRIFTCGVPPRAGALSAEVHTLVRRKPRNVSACAAVGKSRSMTT